VSAGLFITLEGGDGVGKSTQAALLEEWLTGLGRTVVRTREPGGTAAGVEIREIVLHHRGDIAPRAEALLYAADRAHHIATLVRPALERGEVVVQDRYIDSSVAYQGAGRVLDAQQIRDLSLWAAEGLLPDLTILLDLDEDTARARLDTARTRYDRLEAERSDFHARVRAAYLELAAAEPGRFLVVDASRPVGDPRASRRPRLTRTPVSVVAASLERMTVWDELTGQDEAIEVVRAAAEGSAASSAGATGRGMTHSWLITGPPGSGRSNLAYAFATALLSPGTPEGDLATRRQVEARTHPDLAVLSTERVIISIDEVRSLVSSSQFSPSVGRYRVMIIEDADRMTERTSNVLLKALEEPPERTVWILCAPSEADLLPTIRSRVRTVRLRVPSVGDVAQLIQRRDGVDAETAERAARHAQSHIGMAHRLATHEEARRRREQTLQLALGIRSVSDAVLAAAKLLEIAGADAKAITEERDAEEREHALRSLGIEPGGTIPPALRGQLRQLEEDQKRRATRSLRDGIDRILVDLLSLYRDIMMLQLGTGSELVNRELRPELDALSTHTSPAATLAAMDAIATARERIDGNVAPALALEAMLTTILRGTTARKGSDL